MASTATSSQPLFACTRCNGRHPFEELSQGQQLCKECRGAFPIVKCTYCRTEFQQQSKGNPICKKCEQNMKQFGRPNACEYCNIIAAFIGNKCQRCTNSEKKYGPPLTCDQCKQRCAFDRKDPDGKKKVDGKLLCWLCTLSYKRALAKAKQNDTNIRHTTIGVHKSSHDRHRSSSTSAKRHSESRSHSNSHRHSHADLLSVGAVAAGSSNKKPRIETKSSNGAGLPSAAVSANVDANLHDITSGDHVVAITQLKEQVALLKKQLSKKDQELLEKDKKIAEMNACKSRDERDWRLKFTEAQKHSSEKIDSLNQKMASLQKQNASLIKASKPQNKLAALTPNDSPTNLLAT